MIRLAKKSVALRHWSVGKYFYAPFKRRPLMSLWKRKTAAQRKLAFCRAFFAQMWLFFLFCPAAGGSAGRHSGLRPRNRGALRLSSIIYRTPLCFLNPSNYTEERWIHNHRKLTTNKSDPIHIKKILTVGSLIWLLLFIYNFNPNFFILALA